MQVKRGAIVYNGMKADHDGAPFWPWSAQATVVNPAGFRRRLSALCAIAAGIGI